MLKRSVIVVLFTSFPGLLALVLTVAAHAQEEPPLVMTPAQVQTFKERAQRTVRTSVTPRRTLDVNPNTERRNPPQTNITTPGPFDTPGVTPEDIATANRWCRSMGYESICGRGDVVRRWWNRLSAGDTIDPAIMMAMENFDSPAVDCDYVYYVPKEIDNRWPEVTIWRNGVAHLFPMAALTCTPTTHGDRMCKAVITAPCVNEKWLSSYAWGAHVSMPFNQIPIRQ